MDVTSGAAEYLFTTIRLDSDATLGDVLGLLDNPVMRTVFRREYVNEILAEASLGPVVKDQSTHEKLEYIELNQIWNLDSETKEFSCVGQFGVSGQSHLLSEDVIEDEWPMYKAGQRINWSISMTSVRELLNTPVRVQSAVQICEEDVFAKRFGQSIQTAVNHHISLGTLIRSLLWELSWYGTPAQRDAVRADLVESMADIDTARAETVPYTWGTFGRLPTSEVYPWFFEDVSNLDCETIERAIKDLEDGESAQTGLDEIFARKLRLKAEFDTLTGRGLRVALDEARKPKDEPSQLLDQYDASSAYAEEDKAWDNMVPVGREFGSPDYERLVAEDTKAFRANLVGLIEECKRQSSATEVAVSDDEITATLNVQAALLELGQDVTAGVAATVWKHYSSSLAASWMSGAETVHYARKALFMYCSGEPKVWSSFLESRVQTSHAFMQAGHESGYRMNLLNTNQDRTHKQVIILRKDLNMRKGKMIAQGAHASTKAVIDTGEVAQVDGRRCLVVPLDNDSIGPWLFGKFAKVAVSVDSEDELLALHKEAQGRGLVCALLQDAGLTEFGGVPTYTALAIGPHRNAVFESLTSHLKLL